METLEITSCRSELRSRKLTFAAGFELDRLVGLQTLRAFAVSLRENSKPWLRAPFAFWYSSSIAIACYLSVVASVSFYDLFLTVKYAESLEHMEMNPVGRWLMGLDYLKFGQQPDITFFLAMKTFGTLVVLFVMYSLFKRATRIGHPVALGVASFQLVLAFYLTCWLPKE
jgi:hypothetical protein